HILCRGDDVVERTGRAFGGLPTVVRQDLQLVPREGGVFFQRRTDKDAAIAAVVDGVVEFEDEIAVLPFGAQPGAALFRVRAPVLSIAPKQDAIFYCPLATIHHHPAGEIAPVEERFCLLLVAAGAAATSAQANTILKRVMALYPRRKFPTPDDVLATPDEKLRGAGLSRAKVAAIKDIAAKTVEGVVPPARAIAKMPDAEILDRLTTIRGVGP